MPLPNFEHVVLRKSPLRLVIGQVRFQVLPGFGEPSLMARFYDSLREEYPKRSRGQHVSIGLTGKGIQQGPPETIWRFTTRDNTWLVASGEGSISLEARKYSSIDEFLARFERILNLTQMVLDVSERTRVGFRFINEIHRPEARTLADWEKLLRPEFIGFPATDLLDGSIEEMLVQFTAKRPDGTVTVRHGLAERGAFDEDGRAVSAGSSYIIDMDYYDTSERDLDVSQTIALMRDYDHYMFRLFRWAIGDRLYSELEPELCQTT